MALTVDLVRNDLGISETQMGLLLGLSFSLLYSLAGIPVGLLADRISRRYLLAGACAVWSLATMACGLAEGFTGMFIARMLVGAGEAALWPVAVSIIGDLVSPRNRGAVLGWLIIGQLLGSSVSMIVGGQILALGGKGAFNDIVLIGSMAPWRILFFLFGGAGIIAIIMILFAYEPARASHRAEGPGAQPSTRVATYFRSHWRLICALYAAGTLMAVAQYAGASWMLPMLMRRFAITPSEIGFTWGLLGLVSGTAGCLLGGVVTRRFQTPLSRSNLFIVAILICVLEGIFVFQPGIGVTFVVAAIVGLVHGVVGVAKYLLVQEVFPDTMRGIGTAILNLLVNLVGASSGPFMVAVMTEHVFQDDNMVGVSLGLIAGPATLLAVASAFWLRAEFRRRIAQSGSEQNTEPPIGILQTEPA